jgi:DNA polymerase III alpha subunit
MTTPIKTLPPVNEIRSFLAGNVDVILETVAMLKSIAQTDTTTDDLFGESATPEIAQIPWKRNTPTLSMLEVLMSEKNSLGLYVSGNPLTAYLDLYTTVKHILDRDDFYLVVIDKVKKIFTRSNVMMFALQITVAGAQTDYEGIVFPKRASFLSPKLSEKQIFWVKGNILDNKKNSRKNQAEPGSDAEEYEELPKIAFDNLCPIEENPLQLFDNDEISIALQRKTQLNAIPWAQLAAHPELLGAQSTLEQAPHAQQVQKPILVSVPNSVTPALLAQIKEYISNEKKEHFVPIELSIQVKNEWKKVKNITWGDPHTIETLLKAG